MLPLPAAPHDAIEATIGGADALTGEAEHRLERRHRHAPPVEPECVLVEVCLKVLLLDAAVVRALKPRLEIGEDEMDAREDLGGPLRRLLHSLHVAVILAGEAIVAAPTIRDDGAPRLDRSQDER